MSKIRAIRTEADYRAVLARIDSLMDADLDTPEGEELDVLTDLVELYEAKHIPMGYPTALAALRFRMEQAGLSPRDLIPFIGTRAKVSEVLSGKRPLIGAAEQEQCLGQVDRSAVDVVEAVDQLAVPVEILAGHVEERLRDRQRSA